MDSFKGRSGLILQPNDSSVGYSFNFTVCSSSTANDGFLPYGASISSCTVTSTKSDGTSVTDLIESYSIVANTVVVVMGYPSTSGAGRYHLTFLVTTDDGQLVEADFNKVTARDL